MKFFETNIYDRQRKASNPATVNLAHNDYVVTDDEGRAFVAFAGDRAVTINQPYADFVRDIAAVVKADLDAVKAGLDTVKEDLDKVADTGLAGRSVIGPLVRTFAGYFRTNRAT